jgi:nickel/cobalt transporter (NiCoT) family protein
MDLSAIESTWLLVMIVFALGAKHGLDPDHLATIDGLTRFNAGSRPRLARWSGMLFSLGHGVVVTLVAALVATLSGEYAAPAWLEQTGVWISIGFLLLLGGLNIAAVFRAPRGQVVMPHGLRSRLLGRFARADHPVVIASVGAAFALSFDTWSQAALFSLAAQQVSGWAFSVMLGLVFMLGMMAADTVNGLWMARLMAGADRRARVASRFMSLSIGLLSLAIAGLGLVRVTAPEWVRPLEGMGAMMGLGVIGIVLLSYLIAMRLAADSQTQAA